MNETLRLINNRYSCRAFSAKLPPEDDIDDIILAGIMAPSGMNRQGWHITAVTNPELLADMEKTGYEMLCAQASPEMKERLEKRGGTIFYNAPCMIFLSIEPSESGMAEYIDLGILAQNIVIAAESLGLATLHCGLAGYLFTSDRADEFEKKLKFPEGYVHGLAVLVGYPEGERGMPHVAELYKHSFIK